MLFCPENAAVAASATLLLGPGLITSALAHTPSVKTTVSGDKRCISSNGVPNHTIGKFPNSGNPHSFRKQELRFCFDVSPRKNARPTFNTPNVGIGLNGIVIRPGTADWYDPSKRRGFSRNPASGWKLEGMGSAAALGMDQHNAHVDHRGLYHYHGVPVGLVESRKSSLIGYAADGFEIHYVGDKVKSSYVLKPGKRPTPPHGRYDGRFVQDWRYEKGSGTLDQCNGGMLDGRYVYFATETFPFYPRCHWGTVSADFQHPDRGGRPPRHHRSGRGGPLAGAARELGVSERALANAVGHPPPDVARASKILGIPESRIRAALRNNQP